RLRAGLLGGGVARAHGVLPEPGRPEGGGGDAPVGDARQRDRRRAGEGAPGGARGHAEEAQEGDRSRGGEEAMTPGAPDRSPFGSLVFSRWAIARFAVLASLIPLPASAQEACKLLQPAELESALRDWSSGGKAGKSTGAVNNSSGILLDTCHTEIVR